MVSCSEGKKKNKTPKHSRSLSKDNLESILNGNDVYACDIMAYYLPLKTK